MFGEKNINIRELLNHIKNAYRIQAEEKNNKLTVIVDEDIPEYLHADAKRLNQVLNNLVSNAISFTNNGQITIEVQLNEIGPEKIILDFSVIDTGVGMSLDKQNEILKDIKKSTSDIKHDEGMQGHGLTIIRRLLQLHDTDISVKSEPGKGATFFFTLAFTQNELPASVDKPRSVEKLDLKNLKILLVDDIEYNVLIAEKLLLSWNAVVEVATNGEIAVEKVKTNNYDIVIMDLQMPVMDGYSAAASIINLNKQLPIIALTAYYSADIQKKVYDVGMHDFISKPFDPEQLYKTIYKHTFGKSK